MEDVSVLKNADVTDKKISSTTAGAGRNPARAAGFGDSFATLISEGGVNFFRYLKKRGMSGAAGLIVLSSKKHYYYDENDLKRVRVLVNLRRLNVIKHLDMFLNTLVRILPPETSFIGYFSDHKAAGESGSNGRSFARLYDRFNNFLDGRTDRRMNTNDVRDLLERNGFEVENMTTMNGHTYFHSHCAQRAAGLKAS
ncbi:MAG: hypothetical protein WCD55_12580 [Bacteroidales bacterium]